MDKNKPIHFTQAYKIIIPETELDFFDTNLKYDSLLFVDPNLIRKSPVKEERELYDRMGVYFKAAYGKAVRVKMKEGSSQKLLEFLSFPEPKETGLGYTKRSNKGSGLGETFAQVLHAFFLSETAKRLLSKKEVEEDINPEFFSIFTDKVA